MIEQSQAHSLRPYLKAREVADLLNVHKSTVHRFVARGVLAPPVKLSAGVSRFRRESVEAFLRSRAAEA